MDVKTYLGFDVGTKKTGIAIANSLTNKAIGIKTINNHKNGAINWDDFDKIIHANNISLFIVGLALDKNYQPQKMTFIAKSFAKQLTKRYNIKTEFIDEYLSSFDAKKQLKYNHHHTNADRSVVDKQSSQLILQTWLNEKLFNK